SRGAVRRLRANNLRLVETDDVAWTEHPERLLEWRAGGRRCVGRCTRGGQGDHELRSVDSRLHGGRIQRGGGAVAGPWQEDQLRHWPLPTGSAPTSELPGSSELYTTSALVFGPVATAMRSSVCRYVGMRITGMPWLSLIGASVTLGSG